jgi:transcription antitermination factor NusG
MQPEPRWYCARSKPGQEELALDCLQRQNFTTYFPRMTVERAKHGRIVRDSVSLFPGYVLIMFAFAVEYWRAINNTRGVVRLLGSGAEGAPSPLPHGEIERLMQREKRGELFISEVLRLRRGDKVRVKLGWAVDQIGTVVSTKRERVTLLVSLLSREVRVLAPLHALELVTASGQNVARAFEGPRPSFLDNGLARSARSIRPVLAG